MRRFNVFTLEQDLADAHFRLSRTTIESLDWKEIIRRYDRPHTLFYCDPPYWQTEGYGVPFGFEEYTAMADFARSIQGHLLISINDHPDIRQVFSGLAVKAMDYCYSVAGGGQKTACTELLFSNRPFRVAKGLQGGLFEVELVD